MKFKVFVLLFFSIVFSNDKQLYATIQMMDQVMVIDPEALQIDQSVSTEFGDGMQMMDCMDYEMEMDCNMVSGCEWSMDMCMESEDESCMNFEMEMACNMASGCQWVMGMCMDSENEDVMNTPHFIVLDEINGYWFVTTIASGFVAQFSLVDNVLIDTYFVGDAPALLAIDSMNKKIYCSRMMPMNGMGEMMPSSESNIIQALNYSSMGLSEVEAGEYEIASPAPHGLTINDDGSKVYTASNTADWVYEIDTSSGEIEGYPLDSELGNAPDQTTQRLKPIQCLYVEDKLFISCSAGTWYNPYTGISEVIPGELQMWHASSMTLIDSIELGEYSSPWHVASSPVDDVVYVALGGDNLYDTEGLAAIRYENDILVLEWNVSDSSFDTLHGVDVSSDGEKIYVSGRGDGYIHVFDNEGNHINDLSLGTMAMLGGLAIEKKGMPDLGDLNNDETINIFDIVINVENIFIPMLSSPYQEYSGDLNQDQSINIADVVILVNTVLSF